MRLIISVYEGLDARKKPISLWLQCGELWSQAHFLRSPAAQKKTKKKKNDFGPPDRAWPSPYTRMQPDPDPRAWPGPACGRTARAHTRARTHGLDPVRSNHAARCFPVFPRHFPDGFARLTCSPRAFWGCWTIRSSIKWLSWFRCKSGLIGSFFIRILM